MSDTVETDIQRVHVIANEILPRYNLPPITFEQLRKIADGPFDLFLIPLIFAAEYAKDRNLPFNEAKRVEIRRDRIGDRAPGMATMSIRRSFMRASSSR